MFRKLCLVAGGLLGLATMAEAKPYKGAELYSNQSYLYGRYEMRMRVAKASGVLSTFFTYKNGSEIGNTFWEELDIEVFGKNEATQWQSNIILGATRPTQSSEQTHTANASLGDAYHTYVLEWTPAYVAWFLDGVEQRRISDAQTVSQLTNAQSIRFNIWSSESVPWVGEWNDAVLPVYQFVDYLEYQVWDAGSSRFVTGWRDDFDVIDPARWSKANWTFDQNRVDFVPENLVAKDGVLVLALTHENATGFTGTPPSDTSSASAASSDQASSSVASSAAASSEAASSASSLAASSVTAPASIAASSSKASGGGSGGGATGLWHLLILMAAALPRLLSRRR